MSKVRARAIRSVVIAAVVGLIAVTAFQAVDRNDLFELGDGFGTAGSADILGSATQGGCDWADLFDADPTEAEIAAAVAACGGIDAAFVTDQISQGQATDDTVFTKGNKNDDPIASWQWDTGNSPTKNDLSNVYAYATLNQADELILYAGVERLSPGGDSHIDFEFNQASVVLDKAPPCGDDQSAGPDDGPPCEFEGEKSEGDVLVVMDFERGGGLGFVEVRVWDGQAYVVADTVGGEGCNGADTVCAFNNAVDIDGGPWVNFDSKGDPIETLEPNAFTEIGINMTALFGNTPCFVSVQAKSRSSQSFNSSLQDFAQADFTICSFEITKYGSPANPNSGLSKIGDTFIYSYFIENTGGATLFLQSMFDTHPDLQDITQDALDNGCGVLPPGGSCGTPPPTNLTDSATSESLTPEVPFEIVSSVPTDADDPFNTKADATYGNLEPSFGANASAGETGVILSSVSASDDFPLELFQPSVVVVKSGDTLSTPGNVVLYTIEVTNTSSLDSPALANASIVDDVLGDLLDPQNPFVTSSTCTDTLAVGATCTIEAARTVQAGDPDPLPNTVEVHYNPAGGFPNDITDSDSHAVDLVFPGFSLSVSAVPADAVPGDLITYTYVIENTGDVALDEISVLDTLLGDLGPLFPDTLAPGESAQVTVERIVAETDPNPLTNQTTAVYQVQGLPNQLTELASFSVRIVICAKSPGFWKGGEGLPKWDDILSDPIAQDASFEDDTVFPWLDPSLAGSTYLDVLNLPALGDVTRQLSFKYIAARLNEAAFGVPSGTAVLLDDIDLYFAQHPVGSNPQGPAAQQGQSLLNALNDYFTNVGEENCPPSDEF